MSLAHTLLGLLEDHPRHGYELKHLYDERFGGSQEVKFGQIYTTLARLRRDGLVDIAAVESGAGPERKLYLVTPDGGGRSRAVAAVSPSHPRPTGARSCSRRWCSP